MLENGTIIDGFEVIYSIYVRGGRLLLAGSEREYVTGWLEPKIEGVRQEWRYGNFRRSSGDIVVNFMTRYRDANGTNHQTVLNEVREAMSAYQQRGLGK
jgi:hypothetical protein